MTRDEEDVAAATKRFYDAIERMITGGGIKAMHDAWHHTPYASTAHPTGDWAHGWDEVAATWDVFASFGNPKNAGSRVRDIQVRVFGDIAYATSVFVASPGFGSAQLNCTNVLQRLDGVWKVIHHHADKAPSMEKSLETMAKGG